MSGASPRRHARSSGRASTGLRSGTYPRRPSGRPIPLRMLHVCFLRRSSRDDTRQARRDATCPSRARSPRAARIPRPAATTPSARPAHQGVPSEGLDVEARVVRARAGSLGGRAVRSSGTHDIPARTLTTGWSSSPDGARGGATLPDARPAELLARRARHRLAPRSRTRRRAARGATIRRRRPFVYYVVAWAWGSVFGLGEVGLRSLSALAGTATIPVAYGAGAVLVSRRAGLVAAALVAVNPFLVWYSQEARSYALLAFLGAASVLAFGVALRRTAGGGSRGGRIVSALAIATHYFAVFLVAAEAVWLLVRLRPRRPVVLASLIPAATAPRPRAARARPARERRGGRRVGAHGANRRDPEEPRRRLQLPGRGGRKRRRRAARRRRRSCSWHASRRGERRGALVAGSLAAAVVVVPSSSRLVGVDYVIARNTIAAVVPAAVCLGAGYAAGRLGARGGGRAVRALRAAVPLAPALDRQYGRTDWRGAAEALRRRRTCPRAIVVTPYMSRTLWRPYLPGPRASQGRRRRGRREIAVRRARDRGWVLGGPARAAGGGHAEAGRGLPGRRRRAKADVHPRPLPRRPAAPRPARDARRPRADRRAAGRAPAGPLSARASGGRAAGAALASRGESNRDAARGASATARGCRRIPSSRRPGRGS